MASLESGADVGSTHVSASGVLGEPVQADPETMDVSATPSKATAPQASAISGGSGQSSDRPKMIMSLLTAVA